MLGMDHRRARTPRRRRTTLTVEARHRRRSHAPTRARTRRRVDGEAAREDARDGAWEVGFRRGGHRRVDRPSTLRTIWFSAGEKLPGKSPAAVTAADGGGRGGEEEIRRRRRRSE